ncbi:uncharacterized protein MEPE_00974 [Melanopsichium pennsylvanicum]|uniref:Poly(A) RNA polymerase mitochondrial-like central palm domain-containing protein n=2 Tax=Melanopsichium pennsylvanicum TaxID=63383 RepID=A0AAJ4XJJ1_9BASI|nr:conserved hypothetical protein [Melanopsichium pennsylvanicum 4]SNX82268.1 uncharacterized protein MEPE_00974 [Melanopsichium pennsylvanicum]
MVVPPSATQASTFSDLSFPDTLFDRPEATLGSTGKDDLQTIDFGASPAYFSGLESARTTTHTGGPSFGPSSGAYDIRHDSIAMSPNSAISGLDPVSKLGLTSNRSFTHQSPNSNGSALQFSNAESLSRLPAKSAYASHPPDSLSRSEHEASTFTQDMHRAEFARRRAEIERRNRLREERKARRSLAIQKQVDDGMIALRNEKDEAAQRLAEVERRNKQREEEKEERRLAIQKQIEDGIEAIKLEKQRVRTNVEADRNACRKWLSRLLPTNASSSPADALATVDVYAALGCQLRGFWEDSRPAASSQMQRNEVIDDVQLALSNKWPGQGLQVAAFGSSVTGLVTESSDLDLVLLDSTRPYGVGTPPELRCEPNDFVRHTGGMPEWYSTNRIATALRNSGKFRNVVSISGASVPIVKMIHKKYGIPADINVNERFGLFNSQLISVYADLQPDLVRPLIFFLKHWYSKRDLNDPAGKRGSMTFSSYTIALMAMQVLQVEGVLPNLQSPDLLNSLNIRPNFLYSRTKRTRRGGTNGRQDPTEEETQPQKYNVTFASSQVNVEPYRRKALELAQGHHPRASPLDPLLGRLLVSFMRFYRELNRHAHIVSVVNGSPLQRRKGSRPRHVLFDSASEDGESELDKDRAEFSTNPLQTASRDAQGRVELRSELADPFVGDELVVQDPFIIDRNTSRNIKRTAIERWQDEMAGALRVLGLNKAGNSPEVTFQDAPLILDLCISQEVLSDIEADGFDSHTTALAGPEAGPWRQQEVAAAREREIARQAAQMLRKEKKKRARRSRRREAEVLQEEAAMVEDVIDDMETGKITGLMSGTERHEVWRSRADVDASQGGGGQATPIPFTFSVARSPSSASVPSTPKKTEQLNDSTNLSPTMSDGTSRTDASSSSEDLDLVALRLERNAWIA